MYTVVQTISTKYRALNPTPIQDHLTLTYKVTRQGYSVGLCCIIAFPDPKNLENKKKFIAVACIQPEMGKVSIKVTWPSCARSRFKTTVLALVALSFQTRNTKETKKTFIDVACLQLETGTDVGDVMTTWRHGVMLSSLHATTCNYHHVIGQRGSYW